MHVSGYRVSLAKDSTIVCNGVETNARKGISVYWFPLQFDHKFDFPLAINTGTRAQ